jgi:undecaprenyl-phosphate 4-deoxy-4-formamido-L-arabinose transferase
MHQRKISVIVPVYNSVATLTPLIERLSDVCTAHRITAEIILVNDGSRDGSWDCIQELALTFGDVRGVNLMRNYGQHNALLCGIRLATFDTIITLDDDLQHPPEEIPRLIAALTDDYDVVYGTPAVEQHGLWRDLASHITKLALASAMGAETARQVSAFRAFRTGLRDAFAGYQGPFVSVDVLLTWSTTRFTAIPVSHDVRHYGVSNYTFRKLVAHALNMMTGFSVLPLQIASLTGFIFTAFGLGVLAFVLLKYIANGGSVPGFPFLASIIAIFSGAQMFALGVLGEYLARIHFRTMDRPAYAVREFSKSLVEAKSIRNT